MRAGELSVTPEGLNLLIEGTQLIEQIVNAHRGKQDLPAIGELLGRISESLPRAARVAAGSAREVNGSGNGDALEADAARRLWKCAFAPTRDLLDRGIGVDSIRRRLSDVGTIVEASPSVLPDASISLRSTSALSR